MLDLGFNGGVSYNETINASVQEQIWVKPRGISFVSFLLIGHGGAGGYGCSNGTANSTDARSGGSGGTGGISSLIIPADKLPDILYIFVPFGPEGNPSTSGIASTTPAYIAAVPNSTSGLERYLYAAGGGSGGTGTAVQVGPAGGAAPVATINNCTLAAWGAYRFVVGTAGIVGHSGSGGAANSSPAGILNVGTPGGGKPASGSGVAGGSNNPITHISPSISGGQAGGGRGRDGFRVQPDGFCFLGGTGGGSSANNSGNGGEGGKGGIGSGGGGGGGAFGTGGKGGSGGDAICIITGW